MHASRMDGYPPLSGLASDFIPEPARAGRYAGVLDSPTGAGIWDLFNKVSAKVFVATPHEIKVPPPSAGAGTWDLENKVSLSLKTMGEGAQ